MRVLAIVICAALLLPACAVNHQVHAGPGAAFTLSDAGQTAGFHTFDDEKYLRGISNTE